MPLAAASPMMAPGRRDTIPIIISIEIPLPMPLSVIFSPSHMQNSVPAVTIIIVLMVKKVPG